MYELKKVLNLERNVQINDVHFVQMSLVDDTCYVITHKEIYALSKLSFKVPPKPKNKNMVFSF
jgi:hypothetical protein